MVLARGVENSNEIGFLVLGLYEMDGWTLLKRDLSKTNSKSAQIFIFNMLDLYFARLPANGYTFVPVLPVA